MAHPTSPSLPPAPPKPMAISKANQDGRPFALGFCTWPCLGRSGETQVWLHGPFFSFSRLQGILFGGLFLFGLFRSLGGIGWHCFAMLYSWTSTWFQGFLDQRSIFSILCGWQQSGALHSWTQGSHLPRFYLSFSFVQWPFQWDQAF